jgi:hypothetical protein
VKEDKNKTKKAIATMCIHPSPEHLETCRPV